MYLDGEILVSVFFIYIGNGCLRWCQLVLLRLYGAKFASLTPKNLQVSQSGYQVPIKYAPNACRRRRGGQATKCAPNVHQMCTERRPGGGAHAPGYQIGFKWLSNAHQM